MRARPTLWLSGVVATVAAVAAVAATAFAGSSTRAPEPWPAGTIAVRDESGWSRALELAIRQWNAARLPVRFVRAGRRRADVVLVADDERVRDYCAGECDAYVTQTGYRPRARPSEVVLPTRPIHKRLHPGEMDVRLVIHELGHILGLRHHRHECKLMDPKLARFCEWRGRGGAVLCGPLALDVHRAAQLYGVPSRDVDPFCVI